MISRVQIHRDKRWLVTVESALSVETILSREKQREDSYKGVTRVVDRRIVALIFVTQRSLADRDENSSKF